MKKKIINLFIIVFIFLIIIFMFKNPILIKDDVISSVSLWLTKVFPTLFPMLILNDILISCGLPELFKKYFSKFSNKIFNLSGSGSYLLFMSMISGTPANAYILKELYNSSNISLEEANKVIYYCYFSNPMFLYTMLSLMFNDQYIIICIILAHYSSNIIIGLLIRNNCIVTYSTNISRAKKINLTKTIQKGMDTMIIVLGTITVYSLLGIIIINIFRLNRLSIFTGFLEITEGLNMLSKISLNTYIKIVFSISIISFGGLSIHSQIKSIINDTPISYKNFLCGRFYQVIISIIIVSILYFFHIC
ncbi:MAG: hypothetical protein IJ574_01855 [Bacilli bacterium]|nr:hypothetical protein [Bacilli bacterium]